MSCWVTEAGAAIWQLEGGGPEAPAEVLQVDVLKLQTLSCVPLVPPGPVGPNARALEASYLSRSPFQTRSGFHCVLVQPRSPALAGAG